jgi:hypothetical protein
MGECKEKVRAQMIEVSATSVAVKMEMEANIWFRK